MSIRRKAAGLTIAGGLLAGGLAAAAPANALGPTGCSSPTIVLWSGSTPYCYGGANGGIAVAVYGVGGINLKKYATYQFLWGNGWTPVIPGPGDLTASSPMTMHEMWQGPR